MDLDSLRLQINQNTAEYERISQVLTAIIPLLPYLPEGAEYDHVAHTGSDFTNFHLAITCT